MNTRQVAAVLVLLAGGPVLTGCGAAPRPDQESPVVLTDAGHSLKRVALTDLAVERLGIATANVQAAAGGLSMPYAGVIYASDGTSWAYTVVGHNTYLRAPVTVTTITGATVLLSAGPVAGTPVVVVGSPELLGAEVQISGEE